MGWGMKLSGSEGICDKIVRNCFDNKENEGERYGLGWQRRRREIKARK